jgi:hypothetical protein
MNNKIDWKRKLTSRKLWAAICALAVNLIIAFGGTEQVATQVTAIIMGTATVIAYIIGEGLVDAANVGTINIPVYAETEPPDEDEEK